MSSLVSEMPVRRAYHVGNVRNRLLWAAGQILVRGDLQKLSLRAIAAHTGIAPSTVYHHYRDKPALLADVAIMGFDLLARTMRTAIKDMTDPAYSGRAAVGYVEFATQHSALFRLMYEVLNTAEADAVALSERRAFEVLVHALTLDAEGPFAEVARVGLAQDPDGRCAEELIVDASMAIWAAVRGIASIALERRIYEAVAEQETISQAMRGLEFLWGQRHPEAAA